MLLIAWCCFLPLPVWLSFPHYFDDYFTPWVVFFSYAIMVWILTLYELSFPTKLKISLSRNFDFHYRCDSLSHNTDFLFSHYFDDLFIPLYFVIFPFKLSHTSSPIYLPSLLWWFLDPTTLIVFLTLYTVRCFFPALLNDFLIPLLW